MPNARLLDANSIIELRLWPERLTAEIADFIDGCWRPRRARARTQRRAAEGGRAAAAPAGRGGIGTCRRAARRRSAAARSAWPPRPRPRRAAARRRVLGIAVAGALAVAAVAAIVIVVVAGGGDDGNGGTATTPKVPVPPQRVTDMREAAQAAGCTLRSFTPGPRDREHTTEPVEYRQNPPVFGPHDPTWASDGSYVGRPVPPTEKLVHALEHGRVLVQYRKGLAPRRVAQLETLIAERPRPDVPPGYWQLLFENQTGMPAEVAATTWGQQLLCPRFNDGVFDAIRTFRSTYALKAPEPIPQPE